MLPVSGITELSARPNRISPTPPRLRSCRQIGTASKGWRWSSIRVSKVYRSALDFAKPHCATAYGVKQWRHSRPENKSLAPQAVLRSPPHSDRKVANLRGREGPSSNEYFR